MVGTSKEARWLLPLTSLFVVGVTRFELVASSVSGKRSPPELNARICRFGFRVSER